MNKLSIFKVTYMHSSSHKKEKLLYFSENKKMKINILILIYIDLNIRIIFHLKVL